MNTNRPSSKVGNDVAPECSPILYPELVEFHTPCVVNSDDRQERAVALEGVVGGANINSLFIEYSKNGNRSS